MRFAYATGLSFSTWCIWIPAERHDTAQVVDVRRSTGKTEGAYLFYPMFPYARDIISPPRARYTAMTHHEEREEERDHLSWEVAALEEPLPKTPRRSEWKESEAE